MKLHYTTPTPNELYDHYLPRLSDVEFKILCVIIRQTYGWVNKHTGKRKKRDRISNSQFSKKTGKPLRSVSKAVQNLIDQRIITVTDYDGELLHTASARKGKTRIYYAYGYQPVQNLTATYVKKCIEPMSKMTDNKRNFTKEK